MVLLLVPPALYEKIKRALDSWTFQGYYKNSAKRFNQILIVYQHGRCKKESVSLPENRGHRLEAS